MQQKAWLSCTPTKWKQSRAERLIANYGDDAIAQRLPEPGPAAKLVDYLFEVGPMSGEHPVSWGELKAWQESTGARLDEFEAVTVVMLSREYVSMLHRAREPKCPEPWAPVVDAPTRAAISNALGDMFRRMRAEQQSSKAKTRTTKAKQ